MVHDATACSSRSAGSKMTSLLNREPRAILATIGISRAAGRPVTYFGVTAASSMTDCQFRDGSYVVEKCE